MHHPTPRSSSNFPNWLKNVFLHFFSLNYNPNKVHISNLIVMLPTSLLSESSSSKIRQHALKPSECFVKAQMSPLPTAFDAGDWRRLQEYTFLTSSQVMMLLTQEIHFENCCYRLFLLLPNPTYL